MGAVALVWWLTDSSSADHFWRAHGATVLQYALPPVFALIGWSGQQLLAPRSRRSTPDQLTQAQQALARRGLEWWRGVPEPAWPGRLLRAGLRPLDVPWVAVNSQAAVADGPASTGIADLATWLRDGANGRLVIRGEASSGKSILARQVMAEQLSHRRQDDPVPVFLSLWSWNPEQQSLHDWLKYRIALAYPELGDEGTYGPSAVDGLVDQGRVLPILDGLDALPKPRRDGVFSAGEVMSQAPLIITGRTDAVPIIDDFVVIEPGPVSSGESDRFLTEITGRNVRDELRRQFADSVGAGVLDEELPRVLSDPRIIYLASIVYQAPLDEYVPVPRSDVTVDLAARVEGFLLRNLVPALLPAGESWCRTFPWYATRAARWLTRLSLLDLRDPDDRRGADLADPATSRIAWWNLYRGVPLLRRFQAPLRGLVAGLIGFVGSTLIFRYYPPYYGWQYDLMTTGGYGLLILISASFLGGMYGRPADVAPMTGTSRFAILGWIIRYRWPRWWRTILAAAAGFCCFGILIGARVAMETRHTRAEGIRTGLWDGLLQGAVLLVLIYMIAGVPAAPRTVKATDYSAPGRSLAGTFATALLLGAGFGLLWGAGAVLKQESIQVPSLWPALGTGLITGVDFALGSWLFRWSRTWFRPVLVSDPRFAARRDLAGAIVRPLILGATFALSFGITAPLHFVDNYVLAWFVVGLAFGTLDTEWPLYALAISWLALAKRDLPLRLTRFLECCRAAGILRVVGQEYQIHDIGLLRSLQSGGTVTICKRRLRSLHASDRGVTVHNSVLRARRFAWAEVKGFTDGHVHSGRGRYHWVLDIALHSGRTLSVDCTRGSPTTKTLTAVRRVASRYGIPADVAGVPMKNGQPPGPGYYPDPGGQAGLRFWDGTQWSAILPPEVAGPPSGSRSPGSWSALPTAEEGQWTYAVKQGGRWTTSGL